jgi:hypothetical protein
MIERIKLKQGDVVVLTTKSPLPDQLAEKILVELKNMFPDNQVLLPNGAELTIIEQQ